MCSSLQCSTLTVIIYSHTPGHTRLPNPGPGPGRIRSDSLNPGEIRSSQQLAQPLCSFVSSFGGYSILRAPAAVNLELALSLGQQASKPPNSISASLRIVSGYGATFLDVISRINCSAGYNTYVTQKPPTPPGPESIRDGEQHNHGPHTVLEGPMRHHTTRSQQLLHGLPELHVGLALRRLALQPDAK